MNSTLIILIICGCVTAAAAHADDIIAPKAKTFVPRMTTLRGGTLQPASGLHSSSSLQPAAGIEPSGEERGRGPIVVRPTPEEEWRRLFPKKPGQP